MSIEQALAENTAAIQALTAAVIAGEEGRARVLAAAEAAANKAATKPAAAKKTEAAAEKPADKPAETKSDAVSDGPTVEDVNAAIVKYVSGTDRTEEREARKTKVAGVLKKFSPEGTAKPNGGTLAEDKRGAFIKTVDKWIEEGDLTEPPAAENEPSGDDDGLLG